MASGFMVSRDAKRHLGIAMQAPFALVGLRAEVRSPANKSCVKRLRPAEITHAKVEYGACECEFHQPTIADPLALTIDLGSAGDDPQGGEGGIGRVGDPAAIGLHLAQGVQCLPGD